MVEPVRSGAKGYTADIITHPPTATPGPPAEHRTRRLPLTYVLPLRTAGEHDCTDLFEYLRGVAPLVDEVIVVDGSAPEVVRQRAASAPAGVVVTTPETPTLMGKVGGVITGVRAARNDRVVVADDDVRYAATELVRLCELLERADVVRPQNYFVTYPWHARFDTARTLLGRVAGGDWPGTLGLRRDVFVRAGGYRGDVMFENLELVRTVRAAGGREQVALDLLVAREPPTTAHFWGQQVRQAYDELARPVRLVVSLAILPAFLVAWTRGRARPAAALLVASGVLAEIGRRRAGGSRVFPASASLLAPVWLVWRSACSWVALYQWCRGGVRYRGVRLRTAATSSRGLRRLPDHASSRRSAPVRSLRCRLTRRARARRLRRWPAGPRRRVGSRHPRRSQ